MVNTVEHTDDMSYNCATETCVILLTNVTATNSFEKGMNSVSQVGLQL